jgi:hypothetical protein
MNEFAWGSEVSVYTFEPWQKVFLKEIQNQTFYSVKDYQEAQERFLSSAEQNPVFTNLAEFKHEVVGRAGEPLTAHLKYNRVREIDEEKPIVKTILERLSVHLEKAIAESKKHLLMRSPFDVDKLSEEESVRTYLTNIPKKLHNNSSIYIYMFAILDTWLKKTGCRLNEYNYKRLIATSFSLAQDYCNDDAYAYPDQVVAGAFQVKWEVLCNLRKKLLVEIEDEFHFQPELYEKYHAILLPEYNIDLTRRPEPVSSEEKIPAPNPSATETPSPVVDETAPRVTFHF